jgi:hydrogenase nickel incorporation protein HypA/HybF
MHELSITRNIVAVVTERAGRRRVSSVRLAIGKLSGVDVGAVRFCFEACTKDTTLAGAALIVEEIPGRGRCDSCGREVELVEPILRCGCTPTSMLSIVSGDELLVRSMEVTDV